MKDKVYTSIAIDKTAKLVTSKDNARKIDGKERWNTYMSLTRPPIINSTFSKKEHNLTGFKVGSLTVIGIFVKQNPKKNARWVVQCVCGYYTVRSGKSIRGFSNDSTYAQCESCFYSKSLLKQQDPEN